MPPSLRDRRTVTLDTGKRTVEHPVDSLGRMRFRAKLDTCQVRAADSGADYMREFTGHAAMFMKRTWIGSKRWGYWEQVGVNAFDKTIGEADVRFLQNHNPDLLLARNKAGTLRLAADDQGLNTGADLDTRQTYTSDLVISLDRGDVNQMSFAFEPMAYEWSEAEDGNELLTLTEVRLWDVSVVTYPAYEETDAGLRAAGFAALTRSLGVDEADLLGLLDTPDDLRALVARSIAPSDDGATRPAETTGDTSGPAETTRTDGDAVTTPDNLRALRAATRSLGTRLHEEIIR